MKNIRDTPKAQAGQAVQSSPLKESANTEHSNAVAFAGGAFMGTLQGATLGGAAWVLLYAAGFIAAASGATALLAIAGIGAAVFGLAKGLSAVAHNTSPHHAHKHKERETQPTISRSDLRRQAQEQQEDYHYNRFVDREMLRRDERREYRQER